MVTHLRDELQPLGYRSAGWRQSDAPSEDERHQSPRRMASRAPRFSAREASRPPRSWLPEWTNRMCRSARKCLPPRSCSCGNGAARAAAPGSSRTSTRSARPLVFPGVTRLLGHVDQEDAVVADVGEGGAEEQDVTQHLVPGIGGMLLDSGREQPVKYLAERPWLVGLFFVLARVVVSLPGVMGSEAFGVEGARVERGDPGGGRLDDLPPPRLSTSASSRSW
jgi:hypothetical protein